VFEWVRSDQEYHWICHRVSLWPLEQQSGNGVVLSGNYLGVGMDGTTVMENEGGKAIYFASGSGDAVVGGDTDAKGQDRPVAVTLYIAGEGTQ
jgi:hypothetical protein